MEKMEKIEDVDWDHMDYPINLDYREQWGEWSAVREVVQNALDAGDKSEISIYRENGDFIVEDAGDGMEVRHLILGVSEKPENARGQFGEGLKIGLVVLRRLGYTVTILSGNLVLRTDTTEIGGEKCLRVKYKEVDEVMFDGTKVIVHGYSGEKYEDRFIGIDGEDDDVLYTTPRGDLIDRPGEIYVKDIYVDTYDDMQFGYNLVDLELGEDREVVSEWSLKQEIKDLWGYIDDDKLWKKLFNAIKSTACYESTFQWVDRRIGANAREIVKDAFDDVYGDNAVIETRSDFSREAEWRGAEPISDYAVSGLKDVVGTDEMYIRDKENTDDLPVSEDKLSGDQKRVLSHLRRYKRKFYMGDFEEPEIGVYYLDKGVDGRLIGDEIRIDVGKLSELEDALGTLIHEIAHDITNCDDLTKRQIKDIQKIGAQLTLSVDPEVNW